MTTTTQIRTPIHSDSHTETSTSQSWTAWQLRWMLLQLSLLASLFLVLAVVRFNDTSLLWTTQLGSRMLIQVAAVLALGFGIAFVACALMDRQFPSCQVSKPAWGTLIAGLLLAVQFTWLFLPAVFILINGPAAVNIVETLTMP